MWSPGPVSQPVQWESNLLSFGGFSDKVSPNCTQVVVPPPLSLGVLSRPGTGPEVGVGGTWLTVDTCLHNAVLAPGLSKLPLHLFSDW